MCISWWDFDEIGLHNLKKKSAPGALGSIKNLSALSYVCFCKRHLGLVHNYDETILGITRASLRIGTLSCLFFLPLYTLIPVLSEEWGLQSLIYILSSKLNGKPGLEKCYISYLRHLIHASKVLTLSAVLPLCCICCIYCKSAILKIKRSRPRLR